MITNQSSNRSVQLTNPYFSMGSIVVVNTPEMSESTDLSLQDILPYIAVHCCFGIIAILKIHVVR